MHSLAAIHDALTLQGYVLDADKSFEIGAGCRYVVAHTVDDVRVLGFENQNYSYMVALKPQQVFVKGDGASSIQSRLLMHIRVFNQATCHFSYTHVDCRELPLVEFAVAAALDRIEGSCAYLRNNDLRDRGYVMTIEPAHTQDGQSDFFRTKDQSRNHPLSSLVFDEVLAYHSRVAEIVSEITKATHEASAGDLNPAPSCAQP